MKRCTHHQVSLTVEGGGNLVGEHCPGTVRLFCEGVDLTLLEWRFYHDDDMYISEHFDIDNANETTKCFNDSTLDGICICSTY